MTGGIDRMKYRRYCLLIAATHLTLQRPSRLTALYTTRRDHLDAPRPSPGSGQAKSSTMQPRDSCRVPTRGHAKLRKPAGPPVVAAASDTNRAMRVAERRTAETSSAVQPSPPWRVTETGATRFHWLALATGPDRKSTPHGRITRCLNKPCRNF